MIRRPPRSTLSSSSAASDVYKRQPFGPARRGTRKLSGSCWHEVAGTRRRLQSGVVRRPTVIKVLTGRAPPSRAKRRYLAAHGSNRGGGPDDVVVGCGQYLSPGTASGRAAAPDSPGSIPSRLVAKLRPRSGPVRGNDLSATPAADRRREGLRRDEPRPNPGRGGQARSRRS